MTEQRWQGCGHPAIKLKSCHLQRKREILFLVLSCFACFVKPPFQAIERMCGPFSDFYATQMLRGLKHSEKCWTLVKQKFSWLQILMETRKMLEDAVSLHIQSFFYSRNIISANIPIKEMLIQLWIVLQHFSGKNKLKWIVLSQCKFN